MTRLHIGFRYDPDLPNSRGLVVHWPVDAVTETFGIFGVRGSGKSTTAKVLVEELTKAGQQCVIIDPLGVWSGLKSSADGKSEGLPFTIIGGRHADIPINERAGTIIADLVVETNAPLIIDLSQMRKAEGRRFMTAFIEHLWHKANGKPVHVVVDECDLYAPMKPIKGAEALLGAMEDIVRRGRNKGLGSTMISQRPASVHTDIRSQVSVLIAHRLTGTHDRAALDAWVEAHGDRDKRAVMMRDVAALPTGVAWMWSPSFLDLFAEVAVREPWTFDSMATPKPGQRQIVPKKLAKPDVEDLTAKMASIIAEVEQSDPRALQRRIKELEGQLHKEQQALQHNLVQAERLMSAKPVVIEPDLAMPVERLRTSIESALGLFAKQVEDAVLSKQVEVGVMSSPEGKERELKTFPKGHTLTTAEEHPRGGPRHVQHVDRPLSPKDYFGVPERPASPPVMVRERPQHAPVNVGAHERRQRALGEVKTDAYVEQTGDINGPMRKLLIVLAIHGPRSKRQLALQAGYSENGGAFANPLSKLRSMGYVTKGASIEITSAGLAVLGSYEPLPIGYDLVQHWMNSKSMSGPMAKILQVLIDRWPRGYERDELAEIAGYAPTGGAFANPLGKLRTLGLVTKGAPVMLTEEFGRAIS